MFPFHEILLLFLFSLFSLPNFLSATRICVGFPSEFVPTNPTQFLRPKVCLPQRRLHS